MVGCAAVMKKWGALEIKTACGLVEYIQIPESGICDTNPLETYFSDGDGPTIFVTAGVDRNSLNSMLSQYIAEYFGAKELKESIRHILETPEDKLGALELPDLPDDWEQQLENEFLQKHLEMDSEADETYLSKAEASDIMTIVSSALKGTSILDTDVFDMESADEEMDIDSDDIDSLFDPIDAGHATRFDNATFENEEKAASKTGVHLKSGFAGEFYVDPVHKENVNRRFTSCFNNISPTSQRPRIGPVVSNAMLDQNFLIARKGLQISFTPAT
jgi:hypothetical protein